jgi:hypothetical protein
LKRFLECRKHGVHPSGVKKLVCRLSPNKPCLNCEEEEEEEEEEISDVCGQNNTLFVTVSH